MPFHPPLPLIDHGADDVWCHFPPEGFEAISTLARFTHATIDWDRATLDNSHFQPPHVLCSCRYIVNLSNSGTKKERFLFVALWGLGRPIRKHEKIRSRDERAYRVLSYDFQKVLISECHKAHFQRRTIGYVKKEKTLLFCWWIPYGWWILSCPG